ncbi:MAG: hypothetical protein PF495_16740 [Spirochaetales bacterium]|nr:hypothetical protein [Spirochaetales bacterium]
MKLKKKTPDLFLQVENLAKQYESTNGCGWDVLYNAVFNACYSASIYDGHKEHQEKKKNDKLYLEDSKEAVKNLDAVIAFIKRHEERGTFHFNSAMTEFSWGLDNVAEIHATGENRRYSNLTVSFLSELKAALSAEVPKFLTPPHRHQHGCFLYPKPMNDERTATTPRMLAVNLTGLFRLWTSGKLGAIRCEGWPMPVTGKPHHKLVEELVTATFPDEQNIDARSAEANFKHNSPGVLIIPWEQWGK